MVIFARALHFAATPEHSYYEAAVESPCCPATASTAGRVYHRFSVPVRPERCLTRPWCCPVFRILKLGISIVIN